MPRSRYSIFKPIETTYDNIRFRSRLEAKWAYLFKALKIRYIYEPERFVMVYEGVKYVYMPDFYLIDQQCYVEVKGTLATQWERNAAWVLSNMTEKLVHVVCGQIPFPFIDEWYQFDFDTLTYDASISKFPKHLDVRYALNSCIKCGRVEFVPYGDRSLISCACEKRHTNRPTKKIASAFVHARMERFDRKR